MKLPRAGVAELTAWLKEREAMEIPGDLVFPANLEGEPLHKATVYRQTRATFERAGIAVARAGGRTLRNSFAVQQLDQGMPRSELTTALGLALERSTEAYRYARRHEARTTRATATRKPRAIPRLRPIRIRRTGKRPPTGPHQTIRTAASHPGGSSAVSCT